MPEGEVPKFLVHVICGPDGANPDRIPINKGWIDANAETMENIREVACANREIVNGTCDGDVGNTGNVADASFTNTNGRAVLAAHWNDPEFDAEHSAFYYVGVIGTPTLRWATYDANFFNFEMHERTVMQLQKRVETSPIW